MPEILCLSGQQSLGSSAEDLGLWEVRKYLGKIQQPWGRVLGAIMVIAANQGFRGVFWRLESNQRLGGSWIPPEAAARNLGAVIPFGGCWRISAI